jgi:cell division protein FtsB
MAVYEGARRRPGISLPWLERWGRRDAEVEPRAGRDTVHRTGSGAARAGARSGRATRRRAAAVRSRRGPRGVGLLLVAIVAIFSVAFLSLSQSVRVAATGYDIVRLVSEHDRLSALQQDLRSDVERLRSEPAVRKQALEAGLGELGEPIVLPVR